MAWPRLRYKHGVAVNDEVALVEQSSSQGPKRGQAAANGGIISSTPAAATAAARVQRDPFIESFEMTLGKARLWARTIGFLHALSRFLALWNLTSATVVLLGAYAPNLAAHDFRFIVYLLLIEAARLASTSAFLSLLMRPLARQSQAPQNIDHGKDRQYFWSVVVRVAFGVVQLCLAIASMVLPLVGGHLNILLHIHNPSNLMASLCIFYNLVLFNSFVGILTLVFSACAFFSLYKSDTPGEARQESILRYYDTVLQNAKSSGLVQADDFEFFHFAYTMLGGEFSRNVQPQAVARNHKNLIKYMYFHRLGVDFLQIYMDEKDAYVQLAAVNMVGFWADKAWGVGLESELKLPKQVLTKLANKVGTGQVGWAATTCIGVLAGVPQLMEDLAQTRTSAGQSLLDCLADIVDPYSSRSLSIVRTLSQLYEQLCVNEQRPPTPFTDADNNLTPKLKHLAEKARVQRLRVQAAYLLLLMQEPCSSSIIRAINPIQDAYWFRSETEMLELLVSGHNEDAPKSNFPAIREDKKIKPPAWALPSGAISA